MYPFLEIRPNLPLTEGRNSFGLYYSLAVRLKIIEFSEFVLVAKVSQVGITSCLA